MAGAADVCQIKVNVDFIGSAFASGAAADDGQGDGGLASQNDALLEQFPDVKESLLQQVQSMPSEAAAQHEKDRKLKFLSQTAVQQTLQRILSSVVLGYEGAQILVDFDVIECEQDLLQALTNCAASNLLASGFRLKCVPTAICVLADEAKEDAEKYLVDPTLAQLAQAKSTHTHKLFAVLDSQKEEFIYTDLRSYTHQGMGAEGMERLMGVALSCGKKMHECIM